MMSIFDACDFVIVRLVAGGHYLNILKLHKILYYCQAWSLAFGRGRLFDEGFQAWVHGPVSRTVYNHFVATKALYSPIGLSDVRDGFDINQVATIHSTLIGAILESYGHLTGDQLEVMTHDEEPWIEARQGVPANQRSENIIADETMRRYYAARLH